MLKLNNNYICGLDIGSSKVAACLLKARGRKRWSVFFESLPSKGVKAGIVVDSLELVNTVSSLLKALKTKSETNIKYLYVNISGQDIITKHSHAIVPLAEKGNKVITAQDIQRVNEQARILGSSLEEEIIQSLADSYSIDSKNNIINPIGLYSHRLEVDLLLVCAKLSSMQGLSRVINQAGYDMTDLFLSGLATSRTVADDEFRQGVNLFCDIGSDTSELVLFKDGVMKGMDILNIGGDDLTEELRRELKIPFELAEDIKCSYAIIGDAKQIGEDKQILIKKDNFYRPIKQKQVSEVITSKAQSVCSKLKCAIEKIAPYHELNSVIIAGRTVLLEGFIETLENTLSIPVKLARIRNQAVLPLLKENSSLSGQNYLTYLTALGLVCEVLQEKTKIASSQGSPAKNPLIKAINRFKEVYQEYF